MPNMSWKEQYADKLVSMETAAGKISSGDVLVSSIGIGLPYLFLDELAKRKDELEGVRFYFGAASKPFAMLDKEYNRSFQLYDYFISASERNSIKDGSHIIADITFGPKDVPIIVFAVLGFAEKSLGCEVDHIIYGQANFENGRPVNTKICDMSPLY